MHPKIASTATLVDCLIDTFNREEIVYSHWKSNIDLAQAQAGQIDLDLLIDRKCLPRAQMILVRLGFKVVVARWGANPPGICHYYGLDPETKQLIHVHLFTRVLTGESFVKSHLFPFETMLLANVEYVGRMRVTAKPAELVLFTMRTFIKYGSLADLIMLRRKAKSLQTEARWLQAGADLGEALALIDQSCPVIDKQLFIQCVETLTSDTSLRQRIQLAFQVRRRLAVYAKHTPFNRLLAYGQLGWAELQRRLGPKQKNKVLQSGGAVIAIVGADATGKSTLVAETKRWLGDVFAAQVIHTGKPPSSWLTAPVNLALALVRRLSSGKRRTRQAADDASPTQHTFQGRSSLLYAVRSVVLAWDRRRLILRARRRVAAGEFIICDRYPSRTLGAMDSPRLAAEPLKTGTVATLYNRLVRLEKELYDQIPPPDIALKLRVSLETAKQRNRDRNGQDDEAYLEARHRQSRAWQMPGTRYVYEIDTEQSLVETIGCVKQAIWESL